MGAAVTFSMTQGCTTSADNYELPSRNAQTLLSIERNVKGTNSLSYSFCDKSRFGYLYGCSYTTQKNISKSDIADSKFDVSDVLSDEPFKIVNFNFDSYFLTQRALDDLKKMDVSQFENKTIILRGYTDSIGESLYNEKLAQDRARSVEEYLKDYLGLPNVIQTLGFGLCCYVVPNTTEVNREKNRRVEIYLN